ncbi:MAG TPA: YegS/Rv2252/BmrU family lipid kinase [Mobilitalea sp.]|nr:YegS/Rv2252/BmrU family lipid kinase [Mobilitalea sp.]
MKKLLFIFNPAAGRGKIKGKLFEIINTFVKHGYKVTVFPTQTKGDAASIIASEAADYDILVCSGGDGTLNEVISGQMYSGKVVPIGYIPAGSMNDVAHSLKISMEIKNAVMNILNGVPKTMDVGKFNDKYFIYVAAFGAFTDVPYTTSQKHKNMIGNLSYYLEGIKKISDLKAKHVKVLYNDKVIEDDFFIGFVTNSLYIAGFKNVNYSKTSLNDGMFEMLLIKMPKSIFDLEAIISALINNKVNENYFYYIQTSNLTVISDSLEWTLDGEFGGIYDKVEIQNCNNAIEIITPVSKSLKQIFTS